MKKNHMKKMAALLMVAVLGGTVQAFDFSTFPSPIEPGDFLLSAGGGIVPTLEVVFPGGDPSWEIPVLFGGFAKIDYALLIPFTVGVEGGFFAGKTFGRDPGTELALVPIMGRFTWHPNWGVGNLDTYIGVKAGYDRRRSTAAAQVRPEEGLPSAASLEFVIFLLP
jgi:hypothetical protein